MQTKTPTRNIGGGLLCSFGHDTFDLITLNDATVAQVVPQDEEDTYHTVLIRKGFEPLMMASHPNGHSCKCLLDRMKKGDNASTLAQFDYILACGGKVMDRDTYEALLKKF